jgi:hypothetical protein
MAKRRRRRGSWRVIAENELHRLEDSLAAVEELSAKDESATRWIEATSRYLERARQALAPTRRLGRFRDWYSGAAVETTWTSLHRAGESLLWIEPAVELIVEFPNLEATFESNIKENDPRRVKLAPALAEAQRILLTEQRPEKVTDALRAKLVAILYAAHVASDTAHETVRRWRNVLFLTGLAVAILAIVVAAIHAIAPSFLSLVPTDGVTQKHDATEVWEVEVVAAIGGAITAVLALNRFSGFTDPFGLPTIQALVRIPMAAVIGLFGILLMQTSTLGALKPQDGTAILAYAFLFGYAQEPLLRAIDRQAGKVLDPARAKDEPTAATPTRTTPPAQPPGETGGTTQPA